MLSAAVLQSGSALACLPHNCRQPLSQLPSLTNWAARLTSRNSVKPAATAPHATVDKPAVTSDASDQQPPSILVDLQSRQTGRLKFPLLDKQGRIMLKNLTRQELADWVAQQGVLFSASYSCSCHIYVALQMVQHH